MERKKIVRPWGNIKSTLKRIEALIDRIKALDLSKDLEYLRDFYDNKK